MVGAKTTGEKSEKYDAARKWRVSRVREETNERSKESVPTWKSFQRCFEVEWKIV